jgi:hypothetical protein
VGPPPQVRVAQALGPSSGGVSAANSSRATLTPRTIRARDPMERPEMEARDTTFPAALRLALPPLEMSRLQDECRRAGWQALAGPAKLERRGTRSSDLAAFQ